MTLLLLLIACGSAERTREGGTDTGDTAEETAADTTSDTADSTDSAPLADPVCGVRPAEDWWWDGACPKMPTPCIVTMSGCAMTIDYPSIMDMGMPYAGTVDGKQVAFADGAAQTGCRATLVSPDRMTGTCASGCTFELYR